MKALLLSGLLALLALFFLTTFVPTPESTRAEAAQYFSQTDIDAGLRFSFERRLFFWASTAIELGLLIYLIATGAARRLADRFSRWTGGRWLLTLLLVGAAYLLLDWALHLPLSVARFYHSRAWGMTERDVGAWFTEHLLYFGVTAVTEAIVLVPLYVLMRWMPNRWWIPAVAGSLVLATAFVFLMPIVVAPLFNTFTPLWQTRWAYLEPQVRDLTEKAGIPVDEILVMDASRQGNHTNAYFTGFGSTRRIVLYDTLLKNHTTDEVISILAHEIGHWRHDHINKGLLLGAVAAVFGLWLMAAVMRWIVGRPPLYLKSPSDPAGVPLVALLIYLGSWGAMPLENLVSRYFERQADMTSLELAGMPDVFKSAEEKLARDNKSNVAPAPWNVWLFSTHPTAIERIHMAEEWKRDHGR